MSRVVLVLLSLLLVVGALVALDVIPLGLSTDGEGSSGPGDSDLLDADGEKKGLTLEGLGADAASTEGQDGMMGAGTADTPVSSTVTGGTPGGGIVRGRVIRAKSGLPVGGVRVTLGRPDSLVSYLRAKANGRFDELQAKTDEDGRFIFKDITPSQGYAVRALHDDFAVSSHPDRLDLRGRGSIDVGDLKLGLGASIAGRVVDEAEQPLAGVRVAVTWRIQNPLSVVLVHPDTAPEIEREALTDDEGKYLIEKLEPGVKTIFAEAESGAADVKLRINVKDGQRRDLKDMVIPNDRFLAGKVQWKSGGPVQGARVFCAPWQEPAMRATDADEEGAWRLAHLPEGENYTIGALVEGLPIAYTQGVELNQEDIVIEFDDPGALKGVVVQAGTGDAVTRFAIQLDSADPPSDWQMRFVEQQVKQGLGPAPFRSAGGAFAFPQVAPGRYIVNVHAPGFPSIRKQDVVIVVGETTEVRIELPQGHAARGHVERRSGEKVAHARIYALPAGTIKAGSRVLTARRHTDGRQADAATDANGVFELPPQTPGRFDLIAEVDDELPGVLRDVDLSAGDVAGLVLRLPPSGRVEGRIIGEGGRPAAGEEIYVLFPNGVVRTFRSDAEGRFSEGGLPVGRCLVRWVSLNDTKDYFGFIRGREEEESEQGYDRLRQKGEEHVISDGQVTRVSLRLPPRTKVSGRYRIAGGEPPKNKRTFYITVEGGGRWHDVNCNERGEFEFRLPPGSYLAYAPTSGDEFEAVEFSVPDAATHTWDLDLE